MGTEKKKQQKPQLMTKYTIVITEYANKSIIIEYTTKNGIITEYTNKIGTHNKSVSSSLSESELSDLCME